MAGIFDFIPAIAVVLFAAGLVGVVAYERIRIRQVGERDPG